MADRKDPLKLIADAEAARRERREWIKPGGLAGVGTAGPIVECMSYEDPHDSMVFCRMIPGEATSARLVPIAGLRRLAVERLDNDADETAEAIHAVASLSR